MTNAILRCLAIGLLSTVFYFVSTFGFAASSAEMSAEPEKGPHRGRLLKQDDFAIELTIFETGVPPEFRVWAFYENEPLDPQQVSLEVTLTRLGDVKDNIRFEPQGDFLRGDTQIYEPHSFAVKVNATYDDRKYQWQYDNFEGRTKIEPAVAAAMEINTEIAAEAVLTETIEAFGKIVPQEGAQRDISARFEGQIKEVYVASGDTVSKGDKLTAIESNESLKSYTIVSPIDGVVQSRMANAGEQTKGRTLMSIIDTTRFTAELSVFGSDQKRISSGTTVRLTDVDNKINITGKVAAILPHLDSNQGRTIRVNFSDTQGAFTVGQFVSAEIEVAQYSVPLAVKRVGLQSFRDFTVVYAKVGTEYEVRMLELGRQAGEWVEVLGGLKPGTEYVTNNSFVIKADIEKSGASHDH